METHKVINLEASKLLQSLGIECESEKWWNKKTKKLSRLAERFEWGYSFNESGNEEDTRHFIKNLPAPNFQELLALLPAIGEKLGWKKLYNEKGWYKEIVEMTRHNILDTYLINCDMRDVSAEIIRIIKE